MSYSDAASLDAYIADKRYDHSLKIVKVFQQQPLPWRGGTHKLKEKYLTIPSILWPRSYIEGFAFSPKDVEAFSALSLPDAATYPNAYRW